jgi:hypothetical protein
MLRSTIFVLTFLSYLSSPVSSQLFLSPNKLDENAETQEIEAAFIQFVAKYGKSYAAKGEVASRFENFARAYKMVKEHNLKEDATSTMEINQFADLSLEEMPLMKGL